MSVKNVAHFIIKVKNLFRKLKAFVVRHVPKRWYMQRRAEFLNTALYHEVHSIPHDKRVEFEEKIIKQCKRLKYSPEYTRNWLTHTSRLILSFECIKQLISTHGVKTILDMGEESLFAEILKEELKQTKIFSTHGDLRSDFGIGNKTFDMIISTEVLEHITDFPSGYNDSFTLSGLRSTLQLCMKHLKKGGIFFATTPNAGSVMVIDKILRGGMPLMYDPHVREYTLEVIHEEITKAGFELLESRAIHCITTDGEHDYSNIFLFLLEFGYDVDHRGDDLFIVCKKP